MSTSGVLEKTPLSDQVKTRVADPGLVLIVHHAQKVCPHLQLQQSTDQMDFVFWRGPTLGLKSWKLAVWRSCKQLPRVCFRRKVIDSEHASWLLGQELRQPKWAILALQTSASDSSNPASWSQMLWRIGLDTGLRAQLTPVGEAWKSKNLATGKRVLAFAPHFLKIKGSMRPPTKTLKRWPSLLGSQVTAHDPWNECEQRFPN